MQAIDFAHISGSGRANHMGRVTLWALIATTPHALVCFQVPVDRFDLHPMLKRVFLRME